MLCRFPTSLEPVTFDLIPQASPFHCGPSEHWHYSPSKAWKRSLCSTVRRGGAHRNSGGARSQRADLGAGKKKKQVTKDRATYTLSHLVSRPLSFLPGPHGKIQEEKEPPEPPSQIQISPSQTLFFTSWSLGHLSSLDLISLIRQD